MPMRYEAEKTPAGRDFVRITTYGAVTIEDVDAFGAEMAPGRKFANLPILSFIEPGAEFSPQARKRFGSLGDKARVEDRVPTAVVVLNVPLRVLLSFIVKVAGASDSTRFFGDGAEARSWLYSRIDG